MDLTVIVRLEEKVDQLLEQQRALRDENRRLHARQATLEDERRHFRDELDRILGKLEKVGRKGP